MKPQRPATWASMGIDARATWLCKSGLAKNYADACGQLARNRNRKKAVANAPAKMWWQE